MKLSNLFTDDDAVSPVIGVILMVAITVILAAVIGAFVLNIGGSQESAPQVTWDWSDKTNHIELKHQGGDKVKQPAQISVKGPGLDKQLNTFDNVSGGTMAAGDTVWIYNSSGSSPKVSSDADTLELIWMSSDGSDTQILNTHEYDVS